MPRRPPPTSLRLVQGPLPVRGQAKHTLPSVPRPVLVPNDISRSISRGAHEPRIIATPPHDSVYVRMHAYPTSDVNSSLEYGQPRRRPVERGLDTSGLALPYVPSSSGMGLDVGVAVGSGTGMSAGYSSSSSTFALSPLTTPSPGPPPSSQPPMRGPWDHSRAVSLSIDVNSVLALPKPVAISP